mmetsp:Transcript_28185/g.24978  ORF Transcript_28185/g.24978 Transcript_28185/m.24978 type:complete len:91 (+) Transcript_28185:900-1172(+)
MGLTSSGILCKNGLPYTGISTDGLMYNLGIIVSGPHSDGLYYNKGLPADGIMPDNKYYIAGVEFKFDWATLEGSDEFKTLIGHIKKNGSV